MAEIEITHRCNLRCSGCAIINDINKSKHELTGDQILNFLQQAKENKIFSYSLTGGEPFLNLKLLENVIKNSPINLFKINTNGYVFSTRKKTQRVLLKLKKSGFAVKNKNSRSWLNISFGQQTTQGIPLENSLHVLNCFFNIFPKEKAGVSFNVFSTSLEYSTFIIEEFKKKYKKLTGEEFDNTKFPIKIIPPDGRKCLTVNVVPLNEKEMTIRNLIYYYLLQGKAILNCSPKETLSENYFFAPRLLLRANASVYSCSGFSYVHKLGNVNSQNLKDMLERANKNIVTKTVFKGGLKALLKLAEKYEPDIGEQKISVNNGPCDICRILKNNIMFSKKINNN